MKKFTLSTAVVGVLSATAVGFAGTAAAAPTGDTSAADTINGLRAQGYSVQINGTAAVPLSQCIVTGVHGLSNSVDPTKLNTVYVDVDCPSND